MIYDEIYKKYYQLIVSYSFGVLKDKFYAEEVANNTFALLWSRWDHMDFRTDNALLSWLFQTADYKMQEHWRKKPYNYIPIQNSSDINVITENEDIDSAQEEQKFREYMSEVRNRLTGDDLKLFDFKIVLKWPYIRIAEKLNTTVPAIKMRWLRLKTRLLDIVRDITGEEL